MAELSSRPPTIHHSREPDGARPSPGQPPEDAGTGGRRQRDEKVQAWLSDRPDQAETAAKQNDEEDDLPEERDPGLKQGPRFLAILADRVLVLDPASVDY